MIAAIFVNDKTELTNQCAKERGRTKRLEIEPIVFVVLQFSVFHRKVKPK